MRGVLSQIRVCILSFRGPIVKIHTRARTPRINHDSVVNVILNIRRHEGRERLAAVEKTSVEILNRRFSLCVEGITVLERALEEEQELDAIEKLSKAKADNLVDLKAVDGFEKLKKINFKQKPIEIPDFHFDENDLTLYFVTLSALEDNIHEFKKIKTELQSILHNQKLINKMVQLPMESYSPVSDALHSIEASVASSDEVPEMEQTRKQSSSFVRRRISVGIHNFKNIVLPQTSNPSFPGATPQSNLTTDVVSNLMRMSSNANIDVEGVNGIGDIFSRMKNGRFSLS